MRCHRDRARQVCLDDRSCQSERAVIRGDWKTDSRITKTWKKLTVIVSEIPTSQMKVAAFVMSFLFIYFQFSIYQTCLPILKLQNFRGLAQ